MAKKKSELERKREFMKKSGATDMMKKLERKKKKPTKKQKRQLKRTPGF